ncbi:MAG: class I SAM-dependent methyltransferase [Anaerolineales bacterium]|nr:class I SAM-dependent methyltransferase [Anaerolineales bacterium]MCK5315770.1 class I SAM-dependent methyltransferase [Anaerolineales bacterium]
MQENIEILPVTLLDQHRETVTELKQLARSLRLDFGWHYLLDLTWMITQLGPVDGRRIMDAGAGIGVMQWYLADHGAKVISIDRFSRANLPLRFRSRFNVRGARQDDLAPASQVFLDNLNAQSNLKLTIPSQVRDLLGMADWRRAKGNVTIHNQDLKHMPDVENNSIDAIVAVSALEHNQPEELESVVAEMMRVLKPGGALLATLGAARDQDWFHKPSHGWCYTDTSLRRYFDLPSELPSNYDDYDELLAALRDCAELRDNLAKFYLKSGNNGMPWGIWDPQYQSVGVCKIKKTGVT